MHLRIGLLAALLTTPAPIAAEPLDLVGAYTFVGQTSNDDTLDESTTGSADFLTSWTRGPGRLEIYVEGNTSLKRNGIATRLPRTNADAGSALDADRSGRIQLSELKYTYTGQRGGWAAAGLLDPSAYMDATRIGNDENQQFLGASFVNNPTIEFPDYTLGVAAALPPSEAWGRWKLVLTSSNGLADNPNLSYEQLLNVHEDDKGAFVGSEGAWLTERYLIRAGAWVNTSDHDTLDGSETDATNHGLYTAIGTASGRWAANLRLGTADPEVALVESFASLSLQRERGRLTLGAAAANIWISGESPTRTSAHGLHLEGYARIRVGRELYLTPSLQYLDNGRFDVPGSPAGRDVLVASLRLHHVFFRRGAS